ncbi:hypothetical protein F4X90_17830 [Candidatus Poribacteria bacterium]|nr:hypothetical protein [Candidatus Poribacteria bacterium]
MRAGALSDEQNVEFLNENFINTWITTAELAPKPNIQEGIAKRREHKSRNFATYPLARTIMKGWKTGSKKSSPADCFVISPYLELMGRQPVNDLGDDSRSRGLRAYAYYFTFLKDALVGRFPGLGNLILKKEQPSLEVLNTFRTPMVVHQDYTVFVIDTTAFEDGGTLTINIQVGGDDAKGKFHLFDGDRELPTEKAPDGIDVEVWNSQQGAEYVKALDALATVWHVDPGDTEQISYRFAQGQLFKLCATGNRWSEKGSINAFIAKVSVEENRNENDQEQNHA